MDTDLHEEVHMKVIQRMFRRRRNDQVVCFKVLNFEEAYQRDREVITKLERELAAGGAIPIKIDFPSQLCCVTVTDPAVKFTDIQKILEAAGLHATLVEVRD